MFPIPETKYALSGDVSIAYQVSGDGPVDMVHFPGFVSHVELQWKLPPYVKYAEQLTSFCRLIRFDKRGTGLSDRHAGIATMEERMDDVRAVMDAAGSEKAFIMGVSEGGPLSALFAATYPERTLGLIIFGASACDTKKADYPWGIDPADIEEICQRVRTNWGGDAAMRKRIEEWLAPSRKGDESLIKAFGDVIRNSASPGAAVDLFRMNCLIDVRPALASIQCPTLVLRREGDQSVSDAECRYMAGLIPGAKFVELPGIDHMEAVGETEALLSELELFVTGKVSDRLHDRILATVLFTDIVDSTKLATMCGDHRWKEIRSEHDAEALAAIQEHRGRFVKSTGDGILATFDGPARAIRCAKAIGERVQGLNLQIRAGLHTGEIDLIGDDISGIAVNLAARIIALAPNGSVAVSRTVKDLVAGSNLSFSELGTHVLKGVPGEWQVYQVA
ncbi:MAG TPA: adenylate/guanylate cyclase domain-containing protein [Fimbriimonadaceae bacterium]|nr:adenylate/guanylate cyclase domain-containing protein [Fimbriimonadaceae bacterium]